MNKKILNILGISLVSMLGAMNSQEPTINKTNNLLNQLGDQSLHTLSFLDMKALTRFTSTSSDADLLKKPLIQELLRKEFIGKEIDKKTTTLKLDPGFRFDLDELIRLEDTEYAKNLFGIETSRRYEKENKISLILDNKGKRKDLILFSFQKISGPNEPFKLVIEDMIISECAKQINISDPFEDLKKEDFIKAIFELQTINFCFFPEQINKFDLGLIDDKLSILFDTYKVKYKYNLDLSRILLFREFIRFWNKIEVNISRELEKRIKIVNRCLEINCSNTFIYIELDNLFEDYLFKSINIPWIIKILKQGKKLEVSESKHPTKWLEQIHRIENLNIKSRNETQFGEISIRLYFFSCPSEYYQIYDERGKTIKFKKKSFLKSLTDDSVEGEDKQRYLEAFLRAIKSEISYQKEYGEYLYDRKYYDGRFMYLKEMAIEELFDLKKNAAMI